MNRKFSYEEFNALANALEDKHALFNKFFMIIRPVFSEEIPTAAVAFNKLGDCVDFIINPEFWDKQNFEQKLFIVSHECMHVILSHGLRMTALNQQERRLANIAMDLVVNYLLVDRFGFNRDEIDPIKEFDDPNNPGQKISSRTYCWTDTIMKDKPLEEDRSFEYYFNVLKQNVTYVDVDADSFDEHGNLDSFNDESFKKKLSKKISDLSEKELKSLKDFLEKKEESKDPSQKQAGTEAGGFWKHFEVPQVSYKRKWEEIIKAWVRSALTSKEVEQWARTPRRMNNVRSNCFLPADMETEEPERHKIDVALFLDTSGSCVHLAERFIKAVRGIPPHRFNVYAFCFDTETYPMDIKKGDLAGFGGTCFQTIDRRVREQEQEMGRKFGAIFVITDGYGTKVNPEDPKKWYWLLSENYRECIPAESNTYDLNMFE